MIAREPYGMKYEERGLSKNTPVSYHKSIYHLESSLRMHYHSSLEINIFHDVAGVINIEGRSISLDTCSCICLLPNILHSYQIEGNGGTIEVLHIAMDRLHLLKGEELLELLAHTHTSVILKDTEINEIRETMYDISSALGLTRSIAILRLIDILSRESSKLFQRSEDDFLQQILSYAEEHYHLRVTLDEASTAVNMSRYHFARKFKLKTGSTFMEYIQNLRLENSLVLLDSGKNVSEASHASGFEDISYFIKRFRGQFGITPGVYMKNSTNKVLK